MNVAITWGDLSGPHSSCLSCKVPVLVNSRSSVQRQPFHALKKARSQRAASSEVFFAQIQDSRGPKFHFLFL